MSDMEPLSNRANSLERARASTCLRSVGTRYGPCICCDMIRGFLGRHPDGGHKQRRPALASTDGDRVRRRGVPRLGDTHDHSSDRGMQVSAKPGPAAPKPNIPVNHDDVRARAASQDPEQTWQFAAIECTWFVLGHRREARDGLADRRVSRPSAKPQARRHRSVRTVVNVHTRNQG